ncbi:hypothetical protein [Salinimicrobium oceani]|uniref:DUF4153 domain-containing protein n=1 Tax=Salinimicrobium oceani TaxID=2722702 RepID=A0ABX1CZY3_9FLAO|nr:hypothetical protein [Salinimicrobium oceani]NJW53823.1 hypothetical protein [Salinimicrobium oceani]
MKEQISHYLNDPVQLEKLYRTNKSSFKKNFNMLYPSIQGSSLADFWNTRLNYEADEINWGSKKDFLFVLSIAFLAGLIAKLPHIFSISEEFFYPRNIGFIVFPILASYFAWKHKLALKKVILLAVTTIAAAVFINVLPHFPESDTLILSCIHLLIVLWTVLGFAYTAGEFKAYNKRLQFLKYNGDLLVLSGLICIAGGLMTAITIGLFTLIDVYIEAFYFGYVVIFGLPAVPVLATYLIEKNPHLVGKISPVIARIFSPLVLVMLISYLAAMIFSGKDPYNDREFLLIFNVLLVGVMAIIFFSVAGASESKKSKPEVVILILLSIVTIIVNGIALSAILFRISEWGITPNRLAVLGANLLILVNLVMVTAKLLKVTSKKAALEDVGETITRYLPVYVIWAVIVTFSFPLIFGVQ